MVTTLQNPLITQYLNSLKLTGHPVNTLKAYRYSLDVFERFMYGQPLTALSAHTVSDYAAYLMDVRKVSLATVSHYLTTLKLFIMYLVEENVLDVAQVPPPRKFSVKVPQKLPAYHNQAELVRVIECVGTKTTLGVRDRAILELLFSSGLRVTELTSLKMEDLLIDDMAVMVRSGKGGKDRICFYGEESAAILRKYLDTARPELSRRNPESQSLFLTHWGHSLSRVSVEHIVRKYGELAGVPGITPHSFRHGMATSLLENGAGLRQIQELLGHASIATTQRYSFVTKVEARKTFDQFHPRARRGMLHDAVR